MALILTTLLACALSACRPEAENLSPRQIIARVDQTMYYPQMQGLRRVKADVDCQNLRDWTEVQKRQNPKEKDFWDKLNLGVRFIWDEKHGGRYEVEGIPDSMPQRQQAVSAFLEGTEIMVVPKTQGEMFKYFQVSKERRGDQTRIIGVNEKASFSKYILTVDDKFRIRKMEFYVANTVSTTETTLQKVGDHYLITRLLTRKEIKLSERDEKSGAEKSKKLVMQIDVQARYRNVEGFYFPEWFEHSQKSLTSGKTLMDTVHAEFKNYRVSKNR